MKANFTLSIIILLLLFSVFGGYFFPKSESYYSIYMIHNNQIVYTKVVPEFELSGYKLNKNILIHKLY